MGFNRGYVRVYAPEYPKASHNRVYEHVLIAEQVLGRLLKPSEHIHHVDENRANNAHGNLVICTSGYHNLLHKRLRALIACGNPNWCKCSFCKVYDDSANLISWGNRGASAHRSCAREYQKAYYHSAQRNSRRRKTV